MEAKKQREKRTRQGNLEVVEETVAHTLRVQDERVILKSEARGRKCRPPPRRSNRFARTKRGDQQADRRGQPDDGQNEQRDVNQPPGRQAQSRLVDLRD